MEYQEYFNEMVKGYIDCMLWVNQEDFKEFEDLNPYEMREFIKNDCTPTIQKIMSKFIESVNENTIDGYLNMFGFEHFGHDLYLTQHGHGSGFWDKFELPDNVRDELTKAVHKLGEVHIMVLDNQAYFDYLGKL